MAVKLKDICTFQSGGTPSRTNNAYFHGPIPWITTVALNGRTIGKESAVEWITEKAIAESAAKVVPERSIMVGTRVGVGKVAMNSVQMSTSQDIISLVGIDESKWDKGFLCKFLQSKELLLKSQARGATIKGIKIDALAALAVPELPLSDQKGVVEILDSVLDIIASRKAQLSALDNLIKARFVEMFGEPHRNQLYPYHTVSELSDVVSGGTPDRKNADYWDGGTIPWVKTTELHNTMISEVEEYITEKGLSESSAKMVPSNTVIIAMYGQGKTRGMTGYLGIEACTNQACACILPTEKVDMRYLWYFLMLSYDELRGLAQGGNQPNLTAGMIKSFPILVPPLAKQKRYVSFVAQIDKSKLALQKSLEETQKLFDSLMQQYFG